VVWVGYDLEPSYALAAASGLLPKRALVHARLAAVRDLEAEDGLPDTLAGRVSEQPGVLAGAPFDSGLERRALTWLHDQVDAALAALGAGRPAGAGKALAAKHFNEASGKEEGGVDQTTLAEWARQFSPEPTVAAQQRALALLCARLELALLQSVVRTSQPRVGCGARAQLPAPCS
jgi:hypothetical protein